MKTAVPEEVIATFSPRVTARQAESRRKRIVKAAPSVLYSLEMITRARRLPAPGLKLPTKTLVKSSRERTLLQWDSNENESSLQTPV